MTADVDQRGRSAATALRSIVDDTIDDAALAIAFEAAVGRAPRQLPVRESAVPPRRRRLVTAVAVAAAVLLLLFLLTRRTERVPVEPSPGPTTPATAPVTVAPAPTTTLTPLDDLGHATTALASIGPSLGFGPYPPDVVVLTDGGVLKISGTFGGPNALEVLDPASGTVKTVGNTLVGRSFPAMVQLADGRLLIAGGDMTPPVTDASGGTSSGPALVSTGEVVDLTTGKSVSAGPMVATRYITRGALLPDGSVLLVGSASNDQGLVDTPVAERYDPRTNSFRRTGDRTSGEQPVELFNLDDGRLLLFGNHSEIYDATAETFTATGGTPADQPTGAVMLPDGRVLSFHGYCPEVHTLESDGFSAAHRAISTELFDPLIGTFNSGPDVPHCVLSAATLPSGQVFVAGYWWSRKTVPSADGGAEQEQTWSGLLDLGSGATAIAPNPNRRNARAVVTSNGRLLLVAGVAVGTGDNFPWADVYP
jgi:hypothetical protein